MHVPEDTVSPSWDGIITNLPIAHTTTTTLSDVQDTIAATATESTEDFSAAPACKYTLADFVTGPRPSADDLTTLLPLISRSSCAGYVLYWMKGKADGSPSTGDEDASLAIGYLRDFKYDKAIPSKIRTDAHRYFFTEKMMDVHLADLRGSHVRDFYGDQKIKASQAYAEARKRVERCADQCFPEWQVEGSDGDLNEGLSV